MTTKVSPPVVAGGEHTVLCQEYLLTFLATVNETHSQHYCYICTVYNDTVDCAHAVAVVKISLFVWILSLAQVN